MYVKTIQGMHDEARTSATIVCGETEVYTIKVGVHQWSTFNPCLLSKDEHTKRQHDERPGCMMFTNDVVLIDENATVWDDNLERGEKDWKQRVENN